MRSLRRVLEDGDPSPEEQIEITKWLEQYPQMDLSARLAERFPYLVAADKPEVGRRS